MKIVNISALVTIILLSGCFINGNEEDKIDRISNDALFIREIYLVEKSELQLKWELIDNRSDEVLIIVDLYDLGYEKGGQLYKEKLKELASELAKGIDQPLKNPKLTRDGKIIEGQNRIILSENELVDRMMSLKYYNKNLLLPIYVEEPKITIDDLKVVKETLISSYVSYFNPNVIGRSTNIKLSANAIDYFVLAPNDIFSFNQVVGQRTRERGYQEATVIVNRQFVMGIGGGICQTSSTLFNAVDEAGLKIIERHTHSREIDYVPRGRDATVAWGGPDFRFKNQYNYPILISAETNLQTGKIQVNIYGPNSLENYIASTR